jgi:F0F1-type ATP synthase assembly protein I
MREDRESFVGRSLRSFQENVNRSGPAAAGSYALIGAIVLLGGLGYLVDVWCRTSPWFLLAGLLVGLVVGFYQLARTVWPR